jgi:hypothetical protein
MPTKQIKVQLSQTLINPVVVTIQVAGTTVFNNSITSEATFDLEVPSDSPAVTSTWSIAVSGGPITISGILNNYASINANVPGVGVSNLGGSSFKFEAGLIASQPTYNGTPNLDLYNVNTYTVDGQITGSGSLPIPNNEICVFDLQIHAWSEQVPWSPTQNYGAAGRVHTYENGYYVTTQPSPPGTLPTNSAYWAPVTEFL